MAVVDADYSTYIEILREHLAKGTHPDGAQQKTLIAILKDACSRTTTGAGVTTYTALITAQKVLLAALDAAACAAGGGTAAAAVIATAVTSLATQVTAINTACPAAPTYNANTGRDG